MKRFLIVGASVLQLPAIIKAKDLGFYVGVVDYNPCAVGISYADEFYNVSTIDIEGVVNVAKKFKPDGIITLATDAPMRAVAAATTQLCLPGISMQTAINATDKGEMIKVFKKYNVDSPWYFIIKKEEDNLEDIVSSLDYPCVVKPTDNAGSRGVSFVNNTKEFKKAYEYALQSSRSGDVIIEEYLNGKEVSVEILVVNSEVNIIAITDKITTGKPHFVELGHSQQTLINGGDLFKIQDLAKRAVSAIGITNGPAHVEIMLTSSGPKMVELGARLGGDCITTHLAPLSTGVDMIRATIELALGLIPEISPNYEKGSAIRYFTAPCGVITAIEGIQLAEKIKGVQEIVFNKKVGDAVVPISNSNDRIGYVISQAENATEAIGVCNEVINRIKIVTV